MYIFTFLGYFLHNYTESRIFATELQRLCFMDNKNIVFGFGEAAKICGVSAQTVSNWVKSGRLNGCYEKISERKFAFNVEKLERRIFNGL